MYYKADQPLEFGECADKARCAFQGPQGAQIVCCPSALILCLALYVKIDLQLDQS